MKTVITASGNNITSDFDKRFGRSAWFCVYDNESNSISFDENNNNITEIGAGILAAKKMAELNVQKVISGDFGPKAKELLDKLNIQIVILPDDDLKIEDILQKLKHFSITSK